MLVNLIAFDGHHNTNSTDINADFDFFQLFGLGDCHATIMATLVADYNRFCPKRQKCFFGNIYWVFITNTLFYVIGVLLGINDVFEILFAISLSFLGLFY